jgi:hypothetical protein
MLIFCSESDFPSTTIFTVARTVEGPRSKYGVSLWLHALPIALTARELLGGEKRGQEG